jgi:hypothetical protein
LWRNAAASDSVKNSAIALTSVFPLLISVLPYISPEILEKKMTFVLLRDSKTNSVIAGENFNIYGHSYLHMFTGLGQLPDALTGSFEEIMDSKGLDLIEKGIVESLVVNFSQHWDLIKTEHVAGPTSESRAYTSTDAAKKMISMSELQNRFKHNPLIHIIQAYVSFSVPPESILDATQTRNENGREFSRMITIENPYATLTIVIQSSSGMAAQQGIWGIQSPDPEDMNRYSVFHFNVLIRMSPSRFRNFSPEMESYRRWYANVVDVLSGFDWPEVARRTQENLSRKAISKTLGLPN